MSITKDPTFKSIMLALVLGYIALVSQSVLAAKGGKPDPIPQPNLLVWVDANGVIIGDAQNEVRMSDARVYFEVNQEIYYTLITQGDFDGYLYYDGFGCEGNAYTDNGNTVVGYVAGMGKDGMLYKASGEVRQMVTLRSTWQRRNNFEGCTNKDEWVQNVLPAEPIVDLSVYAKPFKLKIIPAN